MAYLIETKLLDRAITGVKSLSLASLKSKSEIIWWLDDRRKSAVSAYAKQIGRGISFAIDVEVEDENGYSDRKNIGMDSYGTSMAKSSSETAAFENVKKSALRRLEMLKRGVL